MGIWFLSGVVMVDGMSDGPPTTNGNGRNGKGQFAKGNKCSNGNPYAARIAQWRKALCDTITPEDVGAVVKQLLSAAKLGKPWAVQLFLERCLGKPQAYVDITTGGQSMRTLDDEQAASFQAWMRDQGEKALAE